MHISSGTIRYSPKRKKSDQHWWVILDCDPELGHYYRHLYHLSHHRCRKLAKPFWGSHITILRNEEPEEDYKHLWDLHAGELVEFKYYGGVQDNFSEERFRSFYWVNVICPRLDEVRNELALSPPLRGYHLAIG